MALRLLPFVCVCALLTACPSPPTVDAPGSDTPRADTPAVDAPTVDAPVADTPGATDVPGADVRGSDVPGADVPTADTNVDGGMRTTGERVCEEVVRCFPMIDLASCLDEARAATARAMGFGCADELDAANECTIAAVTASCSPMALACDAPFGDYNRCVIDATGVTEFSCASPGGFLPNCVRYVGSGNDPDMTCMSLAATRVDMCASGGIGRCESASLGGATLTTTYYMPLPMGVTVATLRMSCEAGMGTWTTL